MLMKNTFHEYVRIACGILEPGAELYHIRLHASLVSYGLLPYGTVGLRGPIARNSATTYRIIGTERG